MFRCLSRIKPTDKTGSVGSFTNKCAKTNSQCLQTNITPPFSNSDRVRIDLWEYRQITGIIVIS